MLRRTLVGFLLVGLALAQVAVAEPDPVGSFLPDDQEDDPAGNQTPVTQAQEGLGTVETPATPADGLLDGLLGDAKDLVGGVGDVLAGGVSDTFSAIGDFVAAVAFVVRDGTVWLATATGSGILWSVTGVASLMATTLRFTFTAAGDLFVGTWNLLHDGALGLARLRPAAVPEAAWAGGVATAATGASLASQAGFGNLLKRWGWLASGATPLFSRIAKDDLLDHPLRSEIFETIKTNPGIHISALARQVDAGWGTTIHHLRKLEEKELVAVRVVNNQKCFFQNGGQVTRSAWTQLPELKNETANRIAQYILANPLSPVTGISDALELSPSLVSHHVRKLERADLVEKHREGRFVKLAVTDHARQHVFGQGVETPVPAGAGGIAA